MWARVTVLTAGMLLIITSAFLPWIEVSIHRTLTSPPTTTISTYVLRELPVWGCFPFLVGFPLPILIWTLLQRPAGRHQRRLGRTRLLLLCLAGAAGAVVFVLVAGFSAAPFVIVPSRGVSTSITLLLGGWVCLFGYGLLVVGALLFG